MIKRTKYILILILASVIYDTAAQNSQALYYMNLAQKHFLNPAFRPTNSVYIGLPVISGINLNLNNNFISFDDVFMKSTSSDSSISIFHPEYDINRFIPKIKDINSFEIQSLVQLFGLGFSTGKDLYIFFDVNERVEGNIALPGDILKLGLLGNDHFVGSKIDLSSLRADMRIYHEAGLGFSKNFTDKLRIGIKGKVLLGVGTGSTENKSLGITIDEDYTHTLDADLAVNISAPLLYKEDAEGNLEGIEFDTARFYLNGDLSGSKITDYLLSRQNLGLGVDIGAEYKITDRLAVSAAVTDLGYIKWKRDAKNLQADSRFEFNGIDLGDLYDRNISLDSLKNEYLDSLMNSFNYNNTEIPFTTYLPMGISAGVSFNLTKSFSIGVLSYTKIIGNQFREALTLSANFNLSNYISASLGYTAANHRYDNIGAGLALRAGIFQFYLVSDNIPVRLNKINFTTNKESPGNSPPQTRNHRIYIPDNLQTINVRFGMNLTFGNNVNKKEDKPMFVPTENNLPKK